MSKFFLLVISSVSAFVALHQPTTTSKLYGYVPDGLTAAEYAALKKKEQSGKNLGKSGPRGYKSRSFNSFVEALEKGEAKHLMPVDPRLVKSGKIPLEDVPYMQRAGGSWDGSDLKGAARQRAMKRAGKWTKEDYQYEKGGKVNSFFAPFMKKQEDIKTRAQKAGISTDQQMWRDAGALTPEQARKMKGANILEPKKKFFFF